MRRGTLSRQLSLRVAALVALVAIVLGAISTIAVRQFMYNQLAEQLNTQLNVQKGPPNSDDTDGDQICRAGTTLNNDNPVHGTRALGLQPGSLTAIYLPSSGVYCGNKVVPGGSSTLTNTQLHALFEGVSDDRRSNVTIDGLGSFLAQGVHNPIWYNGVQYDRYQVVAVPTSSVDHLIKQMLALETIVTLGALGAAFVLSRALVAQSLKPLNRLADAATHVSNLELDTGEVSLAVRVPASGTNPASEVGQVGLAFNHMLNNVEGALAARQQSETKVRQFVADASHELRNPLAAIRGYSELTRRHRDDLPPDTAFAMGRIEAESERMSKLVEDMLLLARLDNDPNLELKPVDVVEVVLNAVSDARVAGPDHQWRLDLPEDAVVAQADAFRLHQVVVNLLANARKHTPAGTLVEASVRREGPWAVIRVTDNGPGIDPSIKDVVFERFARADVARAHNKEGSTGLGLAIVQAVMEAHRGTASVESTPGHTCFTLRVPLSH